MAWQLASHWGNRRIARPAPRAEVVSAALLAGWGADEGEPAWVHWRSAVDRAARISLYAAMLLAARFAERAEGAADDLAAVGSFREDMARQVAACQETLAADARYQRVLGGAGFAVNVALLTAWEEVVEGLAGADAAPFVVRAPDRTGSPVEVTLAPLGDRRWRVHPWPLQGERLQLHCEGRRGGAGGGAAGGPLEGVTFALLRPSARG
jgi:hypothetical protein